MIQVISELNYTHIILISKVKNPKKITEYCPISFCNVVYRIIVKRIANKFKIFLDLIISPNQSAFIPNKLITDNIILGYEC